MRLTKGGPFLCLLSAATIRAMSTAGSGAGGTFLFGPHLCKFSQVFYESTLSICFVNIKPILPGHVLVTPKRVCARFSDLTGEEVTDLWATVHRIGPVLERHFGCEALNLAIQDGKASGQSVPHVHVHVLPRKPGDLKRNDDIYEELERQNLGDSLTPGADPDAERKPRTEEMMAAEADELRALFEPDSSPRSSL